MKRSNEPISSVLPSGSIKNEIDGDWSWFIVHKAGAASMTPPSLQNSSM